MTNNERIEKEIMGSRETSTSWKREEILFRRPGKPASYHCRKFDVSLEACFQMEEKIREKGWDEKYAYELEKICEGNYRLYNRYESLDYEVLFNILNASASQRTQAAIKMLNEMKEAK